MSAMAYIFHFSCAIKQLIRLWMQTLWKLCDAIRHLRQAMDGW